MKQYILDLLRSKKFRAALLGTLVAVLAKVGLDLSAEELAIIVSPFTAYVLGQGFADFGKERARLESDKAREG